MKVGYDADDNGLLTGNEQAPGSGYLIGPNVLLTAAHCVYDRNNQQFFDIEIYFGRTATSEGTRIHTQVAAVIDERYATETNGAPYDWALINLGTDAAAGNYFGIGTVPTGDIDDHLAGETITVSGYFELGNDQAQRYTTGVVKGVIGYSRCFTYNIQTYPGMSGCPVFVNDAYMIAWGIHTDGPVDPEISIRDGSGVQFTPIMYQYFCYHIDNGRALYGY